MDVQLPNGQVLKGVPNGTTRAQLAAKLQSNGMEVPKEWMTAQASTPSNVTAAAVVPGDDQSHYGGTGGFNPMLGRLLGTGEVIAESAGIPKGANTSSMANALGPLEAATNVAGSALAAPLAGIAGLGASLVPDASAADTIRKVQDWLTYKPRTAVGQGMLQTATAPLTAAAEGTNYLGERTAEATGSPLLGALVKTAGDVLPAAALHRGLTAERPTAPTAPIKSTPQDAAVAAQNYARARGLDWNLLPASFKAQLTKVAADANNLADLPGPAIERQGLLESLPVPVKGTRGILTRDPVELRNEGNVAATDAGKPIRESRVAANDALLKNLEVLKGTKGRSDPSQVGAQVQDATLRRKAEISKNKYDFLYKKARATEPDATVHVGPLQNMLERNPELQHLGFMKSWLQKADLTSPTKQAKLSDLQDLRTKATGIRAAGGTDGFYAGEVVKAIDEAMQQVPPAAKAWREAQQAFKAHKTEFEEQGAVEKLVTNKSRTDRATALENTWQSIVKGGSIEDLGKVKKSLLTGTNETKKAGVQAWRDLRAQTVQHIINEATKSVTRYENGSPNLTPASMQNAIKSIGRDKLELIFDKATVQQLDKIMEAVRLVKTEPPPIHQGSSTFGNAIAFLERAVGKVPVLGTGTVGVIRGLGMINEIGKGAKINARATSTPLDDAAGKAR